MFCVSPSAARVEGVRSSAAAAEYPVKDYTEGTVDFPSRLQQFVAWLKTIHEQASNRRLERL